MNIYVGNLSHDVTEEDLKNAFAPFGTVTSTKIIMDRETRQPRGFAFVEMSTEAEGNAAIEGLNGQPLKGRRLRVNLGRRKEEGPGGGGRMGGGGGGRDRRPSGGDYDRYNR